MRNGLAQPWVTGEKPLWDFDDNPAFFGQSARWSGRLLGLTPAVEAVSGEAVLLVDLETLGGEIDFTDLVYWPAFAAPRGSTIGASTVWSDGDLAYTIQIDGNTFVQTGGDDGTVTGAFFGLSNDEMGGVLHRDDLTAAFGGRKN